MLELITCIVRIVVLRCEAYIGRLPHPYGQWVDTGDQDPLSDVKLLSKNNQRSFDILLHNPDIESTVIQYQEKVAEIPKLEIQKRD